MSEREARCLCGCHAWGDDDAVGCTSCREADADMYYLGMDRTGRSILEGMVALGERAAKWLRKGKK